MAGILRIAARIQSAGRRPAYNIWHMYSPSSNLADAQTAVDALRDFYTTAATNFQNTATITIGDNVVEITAVPKVIWTPVVRTVVGTTAGTAAQYQLANVCTMRTVFSGKSYRGRVYLGPLASGALNDPSMAGAVVTATTNACNTLVATTLLRVWSDKLQSGQQVTSMTTNGTVETQRRRARA